MTDDLTRNELSIESLGINSKSDDFITLCGECVNTREFTLSHNADYKVCEVCLNN